MRNWLKYIVAAGAAALMVSCGGGGSDGGICLAASCGAPPATNAAYILNLSVTNLSGVATTSASKSNAALVAGTLTKADGSPVGNAVLSFSSDKPDVTFASDRAITGTNGSANVQLNVESDNPATAVVVLTVSASFDGGSPVSKTFALQLLASTSGSSSSSSSSGAGVPSKLRYKSTSPTRIFTSTGSQGNTASERSLVTYEVRDIDDNLVGAGHTVRFDVTRRDGGILTNGSAEQVSVQTNVRGEASVEITSGSQPISLNVLAGLSVFTPPSSGPVPAGVVVSGVQITISGSRPSQTRFSLLWDPGSGCYDIAKELIFPCKVTVTLGDVTGQAIADGTIVQMVSSNGIIVAPVQAGQPSGACVTVNSKCTVEYTGLNGVARGAHVVVAYVRGTGAPLNKPITFDGTWIANSNGLAQNGGNVVVSTDIDLISGNPQSNDFIRMCMASDGPASSTCVAP